MTKAEFQKYQEQTFDSFCKKVIRNTAISIYREMTARAEREVSLSDLSDSDMASLCTVDTYHTYSKEYTVLGHIIKIYNPQIGEALQFIQPKLRDIILLSYFFDYSNTEIANLLRISYSTVINRRNAALNKLKQQIENMGNDTL